jgi:hypothetical protein
MKIRVLFGHLFFFLSIIFCAFQLITLWTARRLEPSPMLLQFSSAVVCLVLGSLAAQSDRRPATIAISVAAFSVCFLALLCGGLLAMWGAGEMAPLKFIIFLAYAGFYGLFGLAFSFLAGKSTTDKAGANA